MDPKYGPQNLYKIHKQLLNNEKLSNVDNRFDFSNNIIWNDFIPL